MGQACFIVVKTRYDACCFFTILHMFCNMRVVAPGMSRDSPSGRLGVRRMPEFRLIHGTHAGQCNSDVVCFCVCHFTRLFRISPIIWRHLIDGWICLVFFPWLADFDAESPRLHLSIKGFLSCLLQSDQSTFGVRAGSRCLSNDGVFLTYIMRFGAEIGTFLRL